MQNKQQPENTPPAAYNARQSPAAPAKPGEHAADLIYSDAEKDIGGVWIYPACYDDFTLAYRRANSLSRGFGLPFAVTLLVPHRDDDAVSEAGYYAFTRHDPRPFIIHIEPRPFVLHIGGVIVNARGEVIGESASGESASGDSIREEAGR